MAFLKDATQIGQSIRSAKAKGCYTHLKTHQEDFERVGDLAREEVVEIREVLPDWLRLWKCVCNQWMEGWLCFE